MAVRLGQGTTDRTTRNSARHGTERHGTRPSCHGQVRWKPGPTQGGNTRSRRAVSSRLSSSFVWSCLVFIPSVPSCPVLACLVSYCPVSSRLMSSYLVSSRLISFYPISSHLLSSCRLVSCRLNSHLVSSRIFRHRAVAAVADHVLV